MNEDGNEYLPFLRTSCLASVRDLHMAPVALSQTFCTCVEATKATTMEHLHVNLIFFLKNPSFLLTFLSRQHMDLSGPATSGRGRGRAVAPLDYLPGRNNQQWEGGDG